MPSRARGRSPLASIIHYVLTAPLAEARQGLEAAKAALQAREEVVPARTRTVPVAPAGAAVVQRAAAVPAAVPASTAPPPAKAPSAPRQRARRSDAGQPRPSRRKQPAVSQAVVGPVAPPARRRRPAVPAAAALNVGRVQPDPLPDSFVPPDAEDAI